MISGTSEAKTWIPIFALRRVSFLLAFSPYLLLYLAVHFGSRSEFKNLWMIFPFAVIFIVIPLADWFIGLDPANPDSDQVDKMNHQLWYTLLPVLVLPIQGFTLFWAAEIYHSAGLGGYGQIAWIVSVGVVGSSVGITSAHELIHRRSRWLQNAGGLILSSMCYGSFKIEHVRSHHQNVATPEDASSARKGISLYRFFPQAVIRNIVCASSIELKRLKKRGFGFWSLRNEFLIWSCVSILIAMMMLWFYGVSGLVFFIAQSFVAVFLLETVNYIEHYGLRRTQRENGTYEPPNPNHSWNYSSFLTNMILFQLQRHSDHHQKASRPYQLIRHLPDAPQFPASYAAMILLAWLPPWWFRIMDKKVEQYATG